jgi:hypothetical protein
MPVYRFYYLDADGHISGPPTVGDFADDRAASEAAQALANEKSIELWEGPRVVARLAPKHPDR